MQYRHGKKAEKLTELALLYGKAKRRLFNTATTPCDSFAAVFTFDDVMPPADRCSVCGLYFCWFRRDSRSGVTTSRATSGGWRKDRNTSGQRGNKFSTSYRDISVIVAENNSVVKPKYQQYTSLNKMLSNFSKVLMAHISFTAVINNRSIEKGISGIRKGTKKNYIYVL